MGSHHGHMALHQRDEQDNKYRFIHIAGLGWVDRAEGTTDDNDPNVLTITSQVYVTEPKTFAGPAVYVTKTPVTTTLGVPATTTTAAQNSYESAKSVINQPKTRSHSSNPTASYGANAVKGTPLSDGQISNQSHGMSAGGKAGVAIGVLAIIGLIAGLALFCIKRRKNQLNDRGEKVDEKHASKGSFFSGTAADASSGSEKRATFRSMASSHTAATAPRLSLRPMTSLLPSIMEKRKSSTNALDVPPMSEKPRSNPFGDDNQVRSVSPSADPFADGDGKSTPEVGTAAAVPITAAGAKGPNNVHRVQLDFKPSMDDELELKSGQLVRMIHEYDDGWALCMRMDRTQQGVCPRTCLSKLPVKPRPQGPPPQGGRNSPPSGFRGPPPHGANMMPRPLTPTGRERSNTARSADIVREEANRTRSQSTSGVSDRAVSPIDVGIPARKPVPGQAM